MTPGGSILPGHRQPSRPTLVSEAPGTVGIGTVLTDNADDYEVSDDHVRNGERYIKVHNVKFPENKVWVKLSDAGPLGIKGQRSRRGPVRRDHGRRGRSAR